MPALLDTAAAELSLLDSYARTAADKAYRAQAFPEAARFYAVAAATLEQVAGRSRERCELLVCRGAALWSGRAFGEAEAAFFEAALNYEAMHPSALARFGASKFHATARKLVEQLEATLQQPIDGDRPIRIRWLGQLVVDVISLLPDDEGALRVRLVALLAAQARRFATRGHAAERSPAFEAVRSAAEAALEAGRAALSELTGCDRDNGLPAGSRNGDAEHEEAYVRDRRILLMPTALVERRTDFDSVTAKAAASQPAAAATRPGVPLASGREAPDRDSPTSAATAMNGHQMRETSPRSPAASPSLVAGLYGHETQAIKPDYQKVLTQREVEVLRRLASGQTSLEMSQDLSVSIRTVGRHITNIYTKISARGRADATAYALRHGITTG